MKSDSEVVRLMCHSSGVMGVIKVKHRGTKLFQILKAHCKLQELTFEDHRMEDSLGRVLDLSQSLADCGVQHHEHIHVYDNTEAGLDADVEEALLEHLEAEAEVASKTLKL